MRLNIHTFDSLALRDYRLLWLGMLTTSLGQWMDQVTRTWLIYSLTHSPLQLGLISATRGLPLLIFGVIAGAAADRYGRKTQLIVSQTGNAILNAILAILVLTGTVQPWHIYVTGFLNGTLQAFQLPARQVLVNDLVGSEYLLNAISLNAAANNLSRSVGPAIAGIFIKLWGVDFCYFIQAAMYAGATLWTVQMVVPQSANIIKHDNNEDRNPSFWGGIQDGMKYVIKQKIILVLLIIALVPVILGMPFVSLMPLFAIDVFHGDSTTQGLLLTMIGVGALMGSLGMASFGRGSGKLLILGAGGFGLSLLFFAYSPNLSIAMLFVLMIGLFNSSYMTQNQTIIQTLVPNEFRGRVIGIYMLDRGLMPLGSLLAGVMASLLGARLAVAIMGISCFLLAVSIGKFEHSLWHLNLKGGGGSYKIS
jgi:MFS family permease